MFDSPYAQLVYDERIDTVICRWKTDATEEEYRKVMLEGIEVLKATKSKTWVDEYLDEVTQMPNDQRWFVNEFLPLTLDVAVENICFIVSGSSVIKDDLATRAASYADFFNVKIFDSVEDFYKVFEAE